MCDYAEYDDWDGHIICEHSGIECPYLGDSQACASSIDGILIEADNFDNY